MNNSNNYNDTVTMEDKPAAFELVVMFTVASLIILLNVPVYIIVPRTKLLTKGATGVAMLNLATLDILLGVNVFVSIILLVVSPAKLNTGTILCDIHGVVNPVLCTSSVITLAFLNLDKFLTLRFPLKYPIRMTPRRALYVMLVIWTVMILLFTIAWIPNSQIKAKLYSASYLCTVDLASHPAYFGASIVVAQVLPTTVCITSFSGICWILKHRKARKLQASENFETSKASRWVKSDWNFVPTIFLMTSSFFVMWTPYFICVVFWEVFTGHTAGPLAEFITSWFGGSNSFINSLIYIPTLQSYRKELCQFLGIKRE